MINMTQEVEVWRQIELIEEDFDLYRETLWRDPSIFAYWAVKNIPTMLELLRQENELADMYRELEY